MSQTSTPYAPLKRFFLCVSPATRGRIEEGGLIVLNDLNGLNVSQLRHEKYEKDSFVRGIS